MEIDYEQLVGWFSQLFWAIVRIGAFVMTVPILGNQLVSPKIKVAMALTLALAVAPLLTPMPNITELNVEVLVQVIVQLAAGVGLGFSTTIFFQLFVLAGQFIGMQMGLGFAAMVDPGNGVQVTAWSQFFLLLVTLTFVVLNGHLILLEVLIEGFGTHNYGVASSLQELFVHIVGMGGWMFMGGLMIALPAVMALLVVNLAFGVMSRSAPQLNVFSLGFPFSLLFGLLIVWVLVQQWLSIFDRYAGEFMGFVGAWGANG